MPEREARSLHVNSGKSVQPINPHQSAWLTHWAGTRFESATHDHLAQFGRSEGDDQDIKKHLTGIEIASDNFGTSKGIRDVDLAMSLKKPGSQSFPFFKRGQESERSSILKEGGETRGVPAFGPQVSHKKLTPALNVGTSSREHHFQPQGESKIPLEQVKYHMFFGDSSYSGSRPSKEKFANNHTTHGPENFRQLTAAFASKDHLPETNFLGQEHPSYCSQSAALNNFPKHEKSEMPPFLRQNKAAAMKNDPSTSRSPAFLEEQYKRMQKHIGMGFFPQQTGSPEMTKPGRPCSFQDGPHFVHDVEMARICAPLSSVEGLPGGLHSFSRTTHSLLITKQTDGKLYQENQIFRESRVSTQLKGDALRELNCIPPLVSHGQRGVKLQLLDSSDQSQENFEDIKAAGDVQKNESSADTDAMDMESFKENRLSATNCCIIQLLPSINNIVVESNLPLPPPIGLSTEKDTRKKRLIELPDINLDLSVLPAASISKPEPCSSRTQSLDMNTLQFNHSSNSKSDECSDSNLGSDPGIRWIKRLKLSTSSSLAPGKTPKMAESSSNGKLNEHKPEPALDICNVKDSVSLKGKRLHKESGFQIGECSTKEQHPSTVSFGKGDSSSLETKREIKDITLSHSWIQRWSHNQNQKNQKTVEVCKAENGSKPATEEFEKKQFPSIAAMALMGKAMTGFQQCKFQKKESCVVWNTKSFEQ
ncbi:LOW QUALITY PROTEIN: hypothetical protein OSB04_015845 [Centaurea solstitialis]|uniref:F-box family protein n=1 Tax=Centaurea solstitialis TaxID=347529 RepID=A0AA38TBR1_9ASTR|nr:LOW QUALITY PROTEIN: hypothetical protein OSB04_015845 [Centaurea solstitialis]